MATPGVMDWRTLIANLLQQPVRGLPMPALGRPQPTQLGNVLSATGQTPTPGIATTAGDSGRPQGMGQRIVGQMVSSQLGRAMEPYVDPEAALQRRLRGVQLPAAIQQATAESQRQAGLDQAFRTPGHLGAYLTKRAPGLLPFTAAIWQQINAFAGDDVYRKSEELEKIIANRLQYERAVSPAVLGVPMEQGAQAGPALDISGMEQATQRALSVPAATAAPAAAAPPYPAPAPVGGPKVRQRPLDILPDEEAAPPGAVPPLLPPGGVAGEALPGPATEQAAPEPPFQPTPSPAPPEPRAAGLTTGLEQIQSRLDTLATTIARLPERTPERLDTFSAAQSMRNEVAEFLGEQHRAIKLADYAIGTGAVRAYEETIESLTRATESADWATAVPALSEARKYYGLVRSQLDPETQRRQDALLARLGEQQRQWWVGVGPVGADLPWREGDAERVIGAAMSSVLVNNLALIAGPLIGAGIGALAGGPVGAARGAVIGRQLTQSLAPAVMGATFATQLAVPSTREAIGLAATAGLVMSPGGVLFLGPVQWALGAVAQGYRTLREKLTGEEDPLVIRPERFTSMLEYAKAVSEEWYEEPIPLIPRLVAELPTGHFMWRGMAVPMLGRTPLPGLMEKARMGYAEIIGEERFRQDLAQRMEPRPDLSDLRKRQSQVEIERQIATERGESVERFDTELRDIGDEAERRAINWEMRRRLGISIMPQSMRDILWQRFQDAPVGEREKPWESGWGWIGYALFLAGRPALEGQIRRMAMDDQAFADSMVEELQAFRDLGVHPRSPVFEVMGSAPSATAARTQPPPSEVLARLVDFPRQDLSAEAIHANLRTFVEMRQKHREWVSQRINEEVDWIRAEDNYGKVRKMYRDSEPHVEGNIAAVRSLLDAHTIKLLEQMEKVEAAGIETGLRREDVATVLREGQDLIGKLWLEQRSRVAEMYQRSRREKWSPHRFAEEVRRFMAPLVAEMRRQEQRDHALVSRLLVRGEGVVPFPAEARKAEPGPAEFSAEERGPEATIAPPPGIEEAGPSLEVERAALRFLADPNDLFARPGPRQGTMVKERVRGRDEPQYIVAFPGVAGEAEVRLPRKQVVMQMTERQWQNQKALLTTEEREVEGKKEKVSRVINVIIPSKGWPSRDDAWLAQLVLDLGWTPVHPMAELFHWVTGATKARLGGLAHLEVNEGYEGLRKVGVVPVLPGRDQVAVLSDRIERENTEGKLSLEQYQAWRAKLARMDRQAATAEMTGRQYEAKVKEREEALVGEREREQEIRAREFMRGEGGEGAEQLVPPEQEAWERRAKQAIQKLKPAETEATGMIPVAFAEAIGMPYGATKIIVPRGNKWISLVDAAGYRWADLGGESVGGRNAWNKAVPLLRSSNYEAAHRVLLTWVTNTMRAAAAVGGGRIRAEQRRKARSDQRILALDGDAVYGYISTNFGEYIGARVPRERMATEELGRETQGYGEGAARAYLDLLRGEAYDEPFIDLRVKPWAPRGKGPRVRREVLAPQRVEGVWDYLDREYGMIQEAMSEYHEFLLKAKTATAPLEPPFSQSAYLSLVNRKAFLDSVFETFEELPLTAEGVRRAAVGERPGAPEEARVEAPLVEAAETTRPLEPISEEASQRASFMERLFTAYQQLVAANPKGSVTPTLRLRDVYQQMTGNVASAKSPGWQAFLKDIYELDQNRVQGPFGYTLGLPASTATRDARNREIGKLITPSGEEKNYYGISFVRFPTREKVPGPSAEAPPTGEPSTPSGDLKTISERTAPGEGPGILQRDLDDGLIDPADAAELSAYIAELFATADDPSLIGGKRIGAVRFRRDAEAALYGAPPVEQRTPEWVGSGRLTSRQQRRLMTLTDWRLPPERAAYESPFGGATERSGFVETTSPALAYAYAEEAPVSPERAPDWLRATVGRKVLEPFQAEGATRGLMAWDSDLPAFLAAVRTGGGKTWIGSAMMAEALRAPDASIVGVLEKRAGWYTWAEALNTMLAEAGHKEPITVYLSGFQGAELRAGEGFPLLRVKDASALGAEMPRMLFMTEDAVRRHQDLLRRPWTHIVLDEAHIYARAESQRAILVQNSLLGGSGWGSPTAKKRAKLLYLTATPFEDIGDFGLYRPLWGMFRPEDWKLFEERLRNGRPGLAGEKSGSPFNRSLPVSATSAMAYEVASRGKMFSMDAYGGEQYLFHPLRVNEVAAKRYEDAVGALRDMRFIADETGRAGITTTAFLPLIERLQANLRWEEAADTARAALQDGLQVVFITRAITSQTRDVGYVARLREQLISGLESDRAAAEQRGDAEGVARYADMAQRVDAAAKRFHAVAETGLGRSPYDLITNEGAFQVAGIADLTGQVSPNKRRGIARDFQEGKLRVAVVSEASASQLDLHDATRGSAQRVVIPLSVDWTAKGWAQKVGRVSRFGQKSAPEYHILSLDNVPTETRFYGALHNRLKQMGSIIHGNPGEFLWNEMLDVFETRPDVARYAVTMALREHPDIAEKMFTARQRQLLAAGNTSFMHDAHAFLNATLFLARDDAERVMGTLGSHIARTMSDIGATAGRSVPISKDQVRGSWDVGTPFGERVRLQVIDDGEFQHIVVSGRVLRDPTLLQVLDLPTSSYFTAFETPTDRRYRNVYHGIDVAPGRLLDLLRYLEHTAPTVAQEMRGSLDARTRLTVLLNSRGMQNALWWQSAELGTRLGFAPPQAITVSKASLHFPYVRMVLPHEWLNSHREIVRGLIRDGDIIPVKQRDTGWVDLYMSYGDALALLEKEGAGAGAFGSPLDIEPGRRTGTGHLDPKGDLIQALSERVKAAEAEAGPTEGLPLDAPGVSEEGRLAREMWDRAKTLSGRFAERGMPEAAERWATMAEFLGKEAGRYGDEYVASLPPGMQDALRDAWPNVQAMVMDREAMTRFLLESGRGLDEVTAGKMAEAMSEMGAELASRLEGKRKAEGRGLSLRDITEAETEMSEFGTTLAANMLGAVSVGALRRSEPTQAARLAGWLNDLVIQQIMRTPSMLWHIMETQLMLYVAAGQVHPSVYLSREARGKLLLESTWRRQPTAGEVREVMGHHIGADVLAHFAFEPGPDPVLSRRDALADFWGALATVVSGAAGVPKRVGAELMGRRAERFDWRATWQAWRDRFAGEGEPAVEHKTALARWLSTWPEALSGKAVQKLYTMVEESSRLGFYYRWFPPFHDRVLMRPEFSMGKALWDRLSQPKGIGVETLNGDLARAVQHYLHSIRGPVSAGRIFGQVRRSFDVAADSPASAILRRWQEHAVGVIADADHTTISQWVGSHRFADRMVHEDMRNSFLIRNQNTTLQEWLRRLLPFFNYEVQSPWLWARAYTSNPVLFGAFNGWYGEEERRRQREGIRSERYNGFETFYSPWGPIAVNPLVGTYPAKMYRYTVARAARNAADPFDEATSIAGHAFVPHPFVMGAFNMLRTREGEQAVTPGGLLAHEPLLAALAQWTSGAPDGFPAISYVEGVYRQLTSGYDSNPFFQSEVNRAVAAKRINPQDATPSQKEAAVREAAMYQMARLLFGYRVKRYDRFEQEELGGLAATLMKYRVRAGERDESLSGYEGGPITTEELWRAFRRLPQGAKRDAMEMHPFIVPYLQVGQAFLPPGQRKERDEEVRAMAAYEVWRNALVARKSEIDRAFGMGTEAADTAGWKAAMANVYRDRDKSLRERREAILKQYGFDPRAFGDIKQLQRLVYRGLATEPGVLSQDPALKRYLERRLERNPELAGIHPWDAAFEDYMGIGAESERYWLDRQGGQVDYDAIFRDRRALLDMLPAEVREYVVTRAGRNLSEGEKSYRAAMEKYRLALSPVTEGGLGLRRWIGVGKDQERAVIEARMALARMRQMANNAAVAGQGGEAGFWRGVAARYLQERLRMLRVDFRRLRRNPDFARWMGMPEQADVQTWLGRPEDVWEKLAVVALAG